MIQKHIKFGIPLLLNMAYMKAPDIEIYFATTGHIFETGRIGRRNLDCLESLFPNNETPVPVHVLFDQCHVKIDPDKRAELLDSYARLLKREFIGDLYQFDCVKASGRMYLFNDISWGSTKRSVEHAFNLCKTVTTLKLSVKLVDSEHQFHYSSYTVELVPVVPSMTQSIVRSVKAKPSYVKGVTFVHEILELDSDIHIAGARVFFDDTFELVPHSTPFATIPLGQPLTHDNLGNLLERAGNMIIDTYTDRAELLKLICLRNAGISGPHIKGNSTYLKPEVYREFTAGMADGVIEGPELDTFCELFRLNPPADFFEVRKTGQMFQIWPKQTTRPFELHNISVSWAEMTADCPAYDRNGPEIQYFPYFTIDVTDEILGGLIIMNAANFGMLPEPRIDRVEEFRQLFGSEIWRKRSLEEVLEHVLAFRMSTHLDLQTNHLFVHPKPGCENTIQTGPVRYVWESMEFVNYDQQELEQAFDGLKSLKEKPFLTIVPAKEFYEGQFELDDMVV